MEVKEAVRRAKAYVADLFSDEGVLVRGLEEIEHDELTGDWHITLSVTRPGFATYAADFKIVVVKEDGEIRAVKHRSFANG